MTSQPLQQIHDLLKNKGLLKKSYPEYEPPQPIIPEVSELENPAQSPETESKNRKEFVNWFESQPETDRQQFELIFGKV